MLEFSAISLASLITFSAKMLVFLLGLAALIFVHELGHFLVARKLGVVVEKFSLGFGPKIFSIKSGETEYLLSAIPLGGYVKMKGEDLEESSLHEPGAVAAAPVQHRLAIAFAGPLFNILFAVAIYIVVYMNGVQTLAPVVGSVKENFPAEAAGLQTRDKILEIDDKPVPFWEDVQDIVHRSPGKVLKFKIQRESSLILNTSIAPLSEEISDLFGDKKKAGLIGISPLVRNITYVKEGSAADRAGLDRLIPTPALAAGRLQIVDERPTYLLLCLRDAD